MTKGPAGDPKAARRQAAVEMIAREEGSLRRTARRYSLCAEDAEDAYQRALEIVLTKAPTDDPRELIRWTQVVTRHEALAIRRQRERLLGNPPGSGAEEEVDLIALIPAVGDGPDVRAEKQERVARSREALMALKPAELRALTLLAEGYSYAEISEMTGFSRTKVNRCLAEGRERFRALVSGSEDGSRCREMLPQLSAFCDGEVADEAAVREHLRACAGCRATLREYRRAAGAAAALAPVLPGPRGLLDRLHDLIEAAQARLPGGGRAAEQASQVASLGGAGGAGAGGGMAAIGGGTGLTAAAKALAICAGTVGGAAACVAGGVVQPPASPIAGPEPKVARIERVAAGALADAAAGSVSRPAPAPGTPPAPSASPRSPSQGRDAGGPTASDAAEVAPVVEAGAVEYTPPAEPAPAPPPTAPPPAPVPPSAPADAGSAAGEFGP